MKIHHVIRGGLLATGVGIGTAMFAATAGAGSSGVLTASAVDHAETAAPVEATVHVESLPLAPAAVPVRIAAVETAPVLTEAADTVATQSVAAPAEEADTMPAEAADLPVVQAGPGPVTPEPGVTTLIDPIVIERDSSVVQAGPGPVSSVDGATTLIDPVTIDRGEPPARP